MHHNFGLYFYLDKKRNNIAYVGKDSNIHKGTRRISHRAPSQVHQQPFNKILQNNLERYQYMEITRDIPNENELNFLEKLFIKYFSPRFNFTEGGDGMCGYRHTEESRKKMSESRKGQVPWCKGLKNCFSEETLKKMSEAHKGIIPWNKGLKGAYTFSDETRKKMSENNGRYWLGKKKPRYLRERLSKACSKYTLWNTSRAYFNKRIFFRNNEKGLRPLRCFGTKFHGTQLPIGYNYDFLSCEIISNLIEEECD